MLLASHPLCRYAPRPYGGRLFLQTHEYNGPFDPIGGPSVVEVLGSSRGTIVKRSHCPVYTSTGGRGVGVPHSVYDGTRGP